MYIFIYMIADILIPYTIYIYMYTYKANKKKRKNTRPSKLLPNQSNVKFSKYNKRVCNLILIIMFYCYIIIIVIVKIMLHNHLLIISNQIGFTKQSHSLTITDDTLYPVSLSLFVVLDKNLNSSGNM